MKVKNFYCASSALHISMLLPSAASPPIATGPLQISWLRPWYKLEQTKKS